MSKPTFDIIAYRARVGLSHAELGSLMNISVRGIAAWEVHQRSDGRKDNGPSSAAVAYMQLIERLWKLYHSLSDSTAKRCIGAFLHEKMRDQGPKRSRRMP